MIARLGEIKKYYEARGSFAFLSNAFHLLFALQHTKRHHYITVHRHESASTPSDVITTAQSDIGAQDAVAVPTSGNVEVDYFGRSECVLLFIVVAVFHEICFFVNALH